MLRQGRSWRNTTPDLTADEVLIMKKRILCFGDSLTWGYDPVTCMRFDDDTRWTGVLQNLAGTGAVIIEEGQNGRTIATDDPTKGFKNGLTYVIPCVESHKPLDLMIITNDGIIIRTPMEAIRSIGRTTKGVRVMNLDGESRIVSVTATEQEPEDEEELPDAEQEPTGMEGQEAPMDVNEAPVPDEDAPQTDEI